MRAAIFALALAACGSKSAPPAEPGAPTTTAPLDVPATDAGSASSATPDDPRCPASNAIGAALDQPCSPEGLGCGAARCRTAKGFCTVIVCKGGVWSAIEVPPPAPSP